MSQGDSLVSPGAGATSHLYRMINHEDEPAMPPGGKKLAKASLKKVLDWIDAGALENEPAPAAGGETNPDQDPFGF